MSRNRPPEPAVDDPLSRIDTSPLDALLRIRAELDLLEGRLQAMQVRRDSVAAAVYARVHDDYERRRDALEADARPLKAAARASHAALRQQLAQAGSEHEAARLDREEIDFRFSLGEFDAAEQQARLVEVDRRLAETGAARERADALHQRFLAAFASQEDLEAGTAEAPTVQLRTLGEHDTQPASPLPPPPPQSGGAATVAMQILPADAAGATQVMRTLKRDGTAPRSDQTLIMRTARLVPRTGESGAQPVVVALKPLLLGSGSECDVKIAGARARHAEIRASMAGFTLTDHGGGVRINGVAVEQHLLRQDDVIDIAGTQYVFRDL